jgi:hypothetical protein
MPSTALHTWNTSSRRALDEIEAAHAAVGGLGRGRRVATRQINHAYTVLLSSQFQRFCRELHSYSADVIADQLPHVALKRILYTRLTDARKLDTGNPNPGNIGSDFNRFNLEFWDLVRAQDRRNVVRQRKLEELNVWRNAIAHQDFHKRRGGRDGLPLAKVREWRAACSALAVDFDEVMRVHLFSLMESPPGEGE